MTAAIAEGPAANGRGSRELSPRHRRPSIARGLLHTFLVITALLWLVPLIWAFYTALRPYADTQQLGYASFGGHYNLTNFANAWSQADLPLYLKNTAIIVIPALLFTLWFASMVAFVVSRYSFRFNMSLLLMFTAANLLPQQTLITPLFRFYRLIDVPTWVSASGTLDDSYLGVILINVAFQTGFCAFVLSNYMRTLPHELVEAARVDGASAWRQYWQITMPLCRPVLGALATLEFAWVYNDFFWATVLMQTGTKRPITAALNNLHGEFFTNNNLVSAAALLVAIPTLIVFFALQRQFVSGLTMGANKG
jgi:multiple sugar transport system permease protein